MLLLCQSVGGEEERGEARERRRGEGGGRALVMAVKYSGSKWIREGLRGAIITMEDGVSSAPLIIFQSEVSVLVLRVQGTPHNV